LQTLEALLEKRDKFDHILVETTGAALARQRGCSQHHGQLWLTLAPAGLADPGPVAQALWADEALEPGAALDAVVTLVDAAHFRAQLAEPQAAEAMQQVAYADVILLNKTDLVVRYRAVSASRVYLSRLSKSPALAHHFRAKPT
jgi:G3E family GTPase